MDWQKSPESVAQTFSEALPEAPTIERRKMFGSPAAFVGGNLFASLHGTTSWCDSPMRLGTRLSVFPGAHAFEPMAGRPMREYVVLPPAIVSDLGALREWLDRGFHFAAGMPPKEKTTPAGKKKPARREP